MNLEDLRKQIDGVDTKIAELISERIKIADEMLRKGVYIIGFGYPVVPQGKARIRIQVSDALTYKDIDYAMDLLSKTYNKIHGI